MRDHVVQRLGHVLQKYKESYGSWKRLAEEIEAVNEDDNKIDRRTLERICGDKWATVQLKISQLVAIDRFFVYHNEEPLLMKDLTLVDSIVESSDVNFLLAARYADDRRDYVVARLDLRSITRMMRTRINQQRMKIWDINDADNWRKVNTRLNGAANISVGSPVANYASEVLLGQMIGVEPGTDRKASELPFFIVAAEYDEPGGSNFVRTPEEAERVIPDVANQTTPDHRAIVINGQLYASTDQEDYALLVAQRSPDNGHVRVVLCGLTGAGTHHLSEIIEKGHPKEVLPVLRTGQKRPPILAVVYKLLTEPEEDARGRIRREVTSHSVVVGPQFIHYHEDEWQFL